MLIDLRLRFFFCKHFDMKKSAPVDLHDFIFKESFADLIAKAKHR